MCRVSSAQQSISRGWPCAVHAGKTFDTRRSRRTSSRKQEKSDQALGTWNKQANCEWRADCCLRVATAPDTGVHQLVPFGYKGTKHSEKISHGSGQVPLLHCSDHGNEFPGSLKGGKFLDQAELVKPARPQLV